MNELGQAKSLTIKNIGIIEDAEIQLNRPLICFYGEIRQGKSTILNAVKWVFGGSFPSDIIRHGESEAFVQLTFERGSIRREWYLARDGSVKARPLVVAQGDNLVSKPVDFVKRFLNPFLLDQDFLRNKTELERRKFFVDLFSLNTEDLDKQIAAAENDAQAIRLKLKGYGDLDLTVVTPPANTVELGEIRAHIIAEHQAGILVIQNELTARRQEYQAEVNRVTAINETSRQLNDLIKRRELSEATHRARVQELQRQLETEQRLLTEDTNWLAEHGATHPELPLPAAPDTAELERKLSIPADTAEVDRLLVEAQTQAVRFEQYQKNLKRKAERDADEAQLQICWATATELRKKRLLKLREVSSKCGIEGLEFDEFGNFSYEGTQAGMLSTSQLMRLSASLSALYPEGFGIDLIDRAESLGKSIFEFVDRAKEQNKTILAAIVGERPAVAPPEVGVFVVESGRVQ